MFARYFFAFVAILFVPFVVQAAIHVKNYDNQKAVRWDDTKWLCVVSDRGSIGGLTLPKVAICKSKLYPVKFWFFPRYLEKDITGCGNFPKSFETALLEIGRGADFIFSNLEDLEKDPHSALFRCCYFGDSGEGFFFVHINAFEKSNGVPYWSVMQFEGDYLDRHVEKNLLDDARSLILPIINR